MESEYGPVPVDPAVPNPIPPPNRPFGIVIDMNRNASAPPVPAPVVPDPSDVPGPSVPRANPLNLLSDQIVEVQTSPTSPVHLLCLDCPEHGSGVEHSMLMDLCMFWNFLSGTLYLSEILLLYIGIHLKL
jgi:hypothetical protein